MTSVRIDTYAGGVARSDSGSSGSSTLSDFVRKRFSGDVPVFGGDPRVGMREFSGALYGSAVGGSDQLISAVQELTRTIRGYSTGPVRVDSPTSPIVMFDKEIANFDEGFRKAATIDGAKLKMMLEASVIEPGDVQSYYLLMQSAQRSVVRKEQSMKIAKEKKVAQVGGFDTVRDEELMNIDVGDVATNITRLVDELDIRWPRVTVLRAVTHDSRFGGRGTNQKLAQVGDAVMRLVLLERYYDSDATPGQLSDKLTHSQSNSVFRDVGMANVTLMKSVVAGLGVDISSKKIMATVVEALYGAAWVTSGIDGVTKLDMHLGAVEST